MPNRLGHGKGAKNRFIGREIRHLQNKKHYPHNVAVAAAVHMYYAKKHHAAHGKKHHG
jgi:hypothetical protein